MLVFTWFIIVMCSAILGHDLVKTNWLWRLVQTKAWLKVLTPLMDFLFLATIHLVQIVIKKRNRVYHFVCLILVIWGSLSCIINTAKEYNKRNMDYPFDLIYQLFLWDLILPPIFYVVVLVVKGWCGRKTEFTFSDYMRNHWHYPRASDIQKYWFLPEGLLFLVGKVPTWMPSEAFRPNIIKNSTEYAHPIGQWISEDLKPEYEKVFEKYIEQYKRDSKLLDSKKVIEIEGGAVIPVQSPPVVSNRDAPLSGAWEQRIDPNSGRAYYFNRQTNVTTWERWEEKVDETSGKTFWVDHFTNSFSWINPHNDSKDRETYAE